MAASRAPSASSSRSRCAARTRRSSRSRRRTRATSRARPPTASCGGSGTRRVPAPERVGEWLATALDMRDRLGAMPFVVRDNASGEIVGSTRYFNVDAANRRLEIGHTWYARRVQRTAINTECKLLLLRSRVRDAALHRRRIPHALVQPCIARGDRAAGRQAGRRAAQPPAPARRQSARHRRVQHHRRRMAGGAPPFAGRARPPALSGNRGFQAEVNRTHTDSVRMYLLRTGGTRGVPRAHSRGRSLRGRQRPNRRAPLRETP